MEASFLSKAEPTARIELMRSLGRLVRGLSALFWGLPLTLLFCVKTAVADWFRPLGMTPPILATALLCYGLWELGYFQKQERLWMATLERAKILALLNLGLSPFLYWWNVLPQIELFSKAVALMVLSVTSFIYYLNVLLPRLAAMLPDETLREEVRYFTRMNRPLVLTLIVLLTVFFLGSEVNAVRPFLYQLRPELDWLRQWIVIMLVLLPVAMTMSLLWKTKEVILTSVFSPSTFA